MRTSIRNKDGGLSASASVGVEIHRPGKLAAGEFRSVSLSHALLAHLILLRNRLTMQLLQHNTYLLQCAKSYEEIGRTKEAVE